MEKNERWFYDNLLARFLRYVAIDTMSDPSLTTRPSTQGQLELAALLISELKSLGVSQIYQDERGFVIAALPPRHCKHRKVIGFLAHMDTSSEVTGKGVSPLVHTEYDGKPIMLGSSSLVLDPALFPELNQYKGGTIITTDGNTLLGADDKAGVAEIMCALEYLIRNPEIPHPGLEIIFTTDEETGRGMDQFPLARLKSQFCYTVDGGDEGKIEVESFEAYKAIVEIRGKSFHLGKAKGKLINAIQLAAQLIAQLPAGEKPETTADREGYYCALDIAGSIESATIQFLIRDFDEKECLRRIEVIKQLAGALEACYPGAAIQVNSIKQYSNMQRFFKADDPGLVLLGKAISMTGITPDFTIIRGGTDGSRLSEMGIPTPNIFTGGHNYHSRYEWIALPAMIRAARTVVNLAQLWAE